MMNLLDGLRPLQDSQMQMAGFFYIGVEDKTHFTDVFRRTDYMPPVDNISYLLKGQGILLDSKRGVDRQYAVFSAEIRCFDRFSWDPI